VQKNISHYGEHSATYKEFIDNLFHNKSLFNSFLVEYKKVTLYLEVLLQNSEFIFDTETSDEIWDVFWGTQFSLSGNRKLLERIQQYSKRYAIAELGFINRIAFPTDVYKYSQSISFMFDDLAPYYDARFPNRLEQMLNDKSIVITEEQKQRARSCIDRIVETHLTKYNHQPIFEPKIGRENVSKVLVVDQVRGDMSISKGLGCDETFKNMLDSAIKENPNADIIVKTHPDTIAGAGGYYTRLEEHDNIYTQTKGINPISLIKYVDKVYVCTSQFGFEALMCGKEVHVFGMPFYAGWGLTKDRQNCNRRTNIRSLEEVFYIAYIMYSYYVNPDKKCPCEIEEAIDYLLKLREEYNKSKKG
jgi:capsular polysaccharide export protein